MPCICSVCSAINRALMPRRSNRLRRFAEAGVNQHFAQTDSLNEPPEACAARSAAVGPEQEYRQQGFQPLAPRRRPRIPVSTTRTDFPAPMQDLHGESPTSSMSNRGVLGKELCEPDLIVRLRTAVSRVCLVGICPARTL